jgi:hypothetical protein
MKRIIINLFLIFHLTTILCWAVPLNTRLVYNMKPLIAPYMVWSGLAQGWNLFAPNPLAMNNRMEAQVTFKDGQTAIWRFPQPQDYGYFKRYYMERPHKFSLDSLMNDKTGFLRPDAARYIARENNTMPNNPPVKIVLVTYKSKIPPPSSKLPEGWKTQTLFAYAVQPGDLK